MAEQAGVVVPLKEVEIIARDVIAAREKQLTERLRPPSKRDIMWFSDVHSCARRNFYAMAEGDQRTMWDTKVQAKMNAGVEWERIIKRELSDIGFEPVLAQKTVEIVRHGKTLARGKMDLGLEYKPTRKIYPVEVKCVQSFMFDALDRWQDFLLNPWTKKYLRQLMLYMYGENVDQGLFLICDFQGHWKLIPVFLDYEFVEQTLDLIETAFDARVSGVAPDRIPYDGQLCGRCEFAHICIPDINSVNSVQTLDSPEAAALLEIRDAHIEAAKKVDKANRNIKKLFEGVKDGVYRIGNFIITRKNKPAMKMVLTDEEKAMLLEKYGAKADKFFNEIERFQNPDPETIYLNAGRIIKFMDDGE